MHTTPSRPASRRFSQLERLAFGDKPFIAEVARRSSSAGSLQAARNAFPTPPATAPPGQRSVSMPGLQMHRATSAPEVQAGLSLDGERSELRGTENSSLGHDPSLAQGRWRKVRHCILQWPSAQERPRNRNRSRTPGAPLSMESPVKKVLARILPVDISPLKPRKPPDAAQSSECQSMSPGKARTPQKKERSIGHANHEKDMTPSKPSKQQEVVLPDKQAMTPQKKERSIGLANNEMDMTPSKPIKQQAVMSAEERRHVVERFRRKLLDRFRSVHDAFKQLDCSDVRDKQLSLSELRLALLQLDVGKAESYTLFKAMDTDDSGKVSVNEFLHALTDVSEEALLWELRCRLDKNGISSNNLHKAFDLIRNFDGEAKNNRTRFGGCVLTGEERAKLRTMRASRQMGRVEWLKFGASLGLTIFETERLFNIIDKDSSGTVDLQEMFVALCAAAPDVSLERFVTKVLIRYERLPEAFRAHAHKGFMGINEFLALCITLDMNKENAMRIWEARERTTRPDSPTRDDPRGEPAMMEDEFVHQLQAWAPATALDGLREQMCEQFGSVAEGRRALQKAGVCRQDVLSSQVFEAGLRATGLQHCDSGLVLSTVAGHRDKHHASPKHGVTLDQVMGAIGGAKSDARSAARVVVRNDMGPYWQQMHAMKNDLRSGLGEPEKLAKNGQFAFGDKGDRLMGAVQKAVDDLKWGQKQLGKRSLSVTLPVQPRKHVSGKGPIRRASRFFTSNG